MSKFKVGDRVKVISTYGDTQRAVLGALGTVTAIDPPATESWARDGDLVTVEQDGHGKVDMFEGRFELVPKFGKGDRVLVTLSGVDVPATVAWGSSSGTGGTVDVRWDSEPTTTNNVPTASVRIDPERQPLTVAVGTVLNNAAELLRVTGQQIVLVDRVHVAGTWSGKSIAWALLDNGMTDSDARSVAYPATVVAVL